VKLPFLPLVWGARHRTYFFFDAEYLRSIGGTTRPLLSIPSLRERSGDFSDAGVQLYDPTTEQIVNGTLNRQPFPSNQIPVFQAKSASSQMDAIPAGAYRAGPLQ